jgi:hypothetical protein
MPAAQEARLKALAPLAPLCRSTVDRSGFDRNAVDRTAVDRKATAVANETVDRLAAELTKLQRSKQELSAERSEAQNRGSCSPESEIEERGRRTKGGCAPEVGCAPERGRLPQ